MALQSRDHRGTGDRSQARHGWHIGRVVFAPHARCRSVSRALAGEDGAVIYWDDAYANAPHIPQGSAYPARWAERAKAFRDERTAAGRARTDLVYGPASRNKLDLFLPDARCNGLVVFVH